MKKMTKEITGGRLRAAALSALALAAVAILMLPSACKKEEAKDTETPQQKATRMIIESLALPPDSKLMETEPEPDMDTLRLKFGTNEDMDAVEAFFNQKITEKNYTTIMQSGSGVSYQDEKNRNITIMWFARDPDLSAYHTVFHVAVYPLPPELKPKEQEKTE